MRYWGSADIDPQSEMVLTLKPDRDVAIFAAGQGFKYIAKENKVISTSFKEYTFAKEGEKTVRIIADRRSMEISINDEIIMTFSVALPNFFWVETDYYVEGTLYDLESIWSE